MNYPPFVLPPPITYPDWPPEYIKIGLEHEKVNPSCDCENCERMYAARAMGRALNTVVPQA